MRKTRNVMCVLLGLGMVLFAAQAKADFISPVSALMTGHAYELGGMGAGNLIGEASSVDYVQVSGAAAMWEADTSSNESPSVDLTFDLGAVYENVSDLYVWSFNWPGTYQVQQRSVAGFDLLGSFDGVNFSPIGSYTSAYIGDTSDQTAQTIALTGADNIQYLRMHVTSTWTGGWHDLSAWTLIGLGEVAAEGTVVPEPMTMIFLALGSLFLRRRIA
jgi:hypothetical protein